MHVTEPVKAYNPRGLLDSSADSQHFSTKLNFFNCYGLVTSKALFKSAIDKDGMDIASLDLLRSCTSLAGTDVIGRNEVLTTLKHTCQLGGSFIIATGGKLVGKSKIMKHVASWTSIKKVQTQMFSQNYATVPSFNVLVDGGLAGDKPVSVAICNELTNLNVAFDPRLDQKNASTGDMPHLLTPLLDSLTRGDESALTTLIIDDADQIFTLPAAEQYLRTGETSPVWEARRKQILKTLDILVAFSKQNGTISVVFSTPDSTFPAKLEELGFPWRRYINEYVVIGEPTPIEAVATVKSWGVGENLALALVDVYGGHLSRISGALIEIVRSHAHVGFWDESVAFGLAETMNLKYGLEEARVAGSELETRVMRTLKFLAVEGFVETSPYLNLYGQPKHAHQSWLPNFLRRVDEMEWEAKVVELLTRHGIAHYVPRDAKIQSLPYNRSDGIVPDTQAVRMLLIREFGKKWMEEEMNEIK